MGAVSTLPSFRAVQPQATTAPVAAVPPTVSEGPSAPRPAHEVVRTEAALRAAWADPRRTRIDLGADITLRDCLLGDPIRETPYPLVLNGHGFTIRQSCFEKRVLRQDGTGWLDIRDVALTRGGSDGPGAALTTRGEVVLRDCAVDQNLAEEPGGGVFAMRRVTVHRCRITGNLANDDGGGIYARRGGVQVYDSVLSGNLVDGSGGAIGSTGDILVVRSKVDGNTTDGDGGALYADEDGDVTVVDSLIDGSVADGPGGAIFTLDGDVAVHNSTLIGNRADDRGGAISGEADVLVVNSTVARNLAVAHVGGGVWARGDLVLVNSTVTSNYAEGEGGGVMAAGDTTLIHSTLTRNIAPVGGDIGAAGRLTGFANIVGPPVVTGVTGDTLPTRRSCRVYASESLGHNFSSDASCRFSRSTDTVGDDPRLAGLEDHPDGFVLVPEPDSPVRSRIPGGSCVGTLPDPLPARQLLEGWVSWSAVLSHDALGQPWGGGACDIGAVQTPAEAAPRLPGTTGHVGPWTRSGPWLTEPRPPVSRPPLPRAGASAHRSRQPGAALGRLGDRLTRLQVRAERFEGLLRCSTRVGVSQLGDPQHGWGFLYDERDGTGLDLRPALARDPSRPQLSLIQLSTRQRCLSAAADPNGAGDDARTLAGAPVARVGDLDALLRQLHRLESRHARVEALTERFDVWESCLTWLPVTQAGDKDQALGYLRTAGRHGVAVDIDSSEWDDPDYQLIALRRDDRPFRGDECGTEPGETVDRQRGSDRSAGREPETWASLREGIGDLREDVADLGEPVDEISRFDQCLYTVGLASRAGYRYRSRAGVDRARSALSLDLRGPRLPQLSVLAFPGEEPPQIECNEDAGGVATDE